MANNQNMDNDLIKELVDYFNGDYEQETTTSEDEKEKAVEQEYLDEPTYSEAKCNDQVLIYIVIDKSASMHSKKLDRDINDQLRKLNHFINDYMGPKHNSDEDILEPEEVIEAPKGLKGNITTDEIRDGEQALLYLVVDKSGSMYNNGLEKAVVAGLNDVKRTVNGSKESKCIQTAMTFFGSDLDMRPFKYGECIDVSYEANGSKTRMYDALVESCNNMISQYDILEPKVKVKGVMLLFTDGGENGSEKYSVNDAKQAVKELKERNIRFLVAAFDGFDSTELAKALDIEPISIKDDHQLRKLMQFVSKTSMA